MMPRMSTSGGMKTLAFYSAAQGKSGRMPELSVKHDVGVFREASRSGQPVPSRLTFASAVQASAHCMSAALCHPGFACGHSTLEGTGCPSLVSDQLDAQRPTRRQDVANKHQQNSTNLGFVAFCPRKSRQDVGVFRKVSPGTQTALRCGRGLGVCGRLWLRSAGFVRGSP